MNWNIIKKFSFIFINLIIKYQGVTSTTDSNTAENGTMLPNVPIETVKHCSYKHKCVNPTYEYSVFNLKRQRPLPLRRKIIEFYTAPITKFLANSVSITNSNAW